jgi:hypothetical protein
MTQGPAIRPNRRRTVRAVQKRSIEVGTSCF